MDQSQEAYNSLMNMALDNHNRTAYGDSLIVDDDFIAGWDELSMNKPGAVYVHRVTRLAGWRKWWNNALAYPRYWWYNARKLTGMIE